MDAASPLCKVRECFKCQGNTEYFCGLCSWDLCFQCAQSHTNDLKTKDHDIRIYRDKFNFICKQEICMRHHESVYKKYCKSCRVPMCDLCSEHKVCKLLTCPFTLSMHNTLSIREAYKKQHQIHRGTFHTLRSETLFTRLILMEEIKTDFRTCDRKMFNIQSDLLTKAVKLRRLLDYAHIGNFNYIFFKQVRKMNRHIARIQSYEHRYEQFSVQFLSFIKNARLPVVNDSPNLSKKYQFSLKPIIKKDVMESLIKIRLSETGKRQEDAKTAIMPKDKIGQAEGTKGPKNKRKRNEKPRDVGSSSAQAESLSEEVQQMMAVPVTLHGDAAPGSPGGMDAAPIPDGVNKEIVKNTDVISGFNELENKEVRSIVVVGKFGSSVFSTSRRISERFELEKKWRSMEYRYTNIPDTVKENTILYVYGWFGMWNDDLCSVVNVKTACQSLIRILNETNNVKLIIGMRSDLYKKYHQELEEADDDMNTSLFHHEIFLDTVDVRKDAKYKTYFKENIQKQCKENGCACKRLTYEMLRKGKDKVVGMPLKINAIQRYHELIPNYLHNWDILKVMRDHFSDMEKDRERRNVYEWIMYICLKGYFCRSDPFDTELVEEMNFGINQSSFDENDTELSRYVRMRNSDKLRNESSENAQYVFWHPFIYICAFHYLFHKDPEFLMNNCNVDAILQLVRPKRFKTSYFEVAANDKCVTLFIERMRRLGKDEEYTHHPLLALFLMFRMFFKMTVIES